MSTVLWNLFNSTFSSSFESGTNIAGSNTPRMITDRPLRTPSSSSDSSGPIAQDSLPFLWRRVSASSVASASTTASRSSSSSSPSSSSSSTAPTLTSTPSHAVGATSTPPNKEKQDSTPCTSNGTRNEVRWNHRQGAGRGRMMLD